MHKALVCLIVLFNLIEESSYMNNLLSASLIAGCILSAGANAGVIFSDNFDSEVPVNQP